MTNVCSICGSTPIAGTRFCRTCGSPLKVASGADGGGQSVSPLAETIPLTNEGRPTEGISPGEAGYSSPDTARVKHHEMERLLSEHPEAGNGGAGVGVVGMEPPPPAMPGNEAQARVTLVDVAVQPPPPPSRRLWQLAALGLLFIALTAGALAFFYSRQPGSSEAGGGAAPISLSDQKKLVEEQLAEAEAQLSAGDTEGAIAKLRYAIKIDPANATAHLMLGRALEKSGARREAIDAYRAAVDADPSNTAAWRALAVAQFSEGLYSDSAESYRRIVTQMNDDAVDDNLRLEYADALRLAGRFQEARALYQKVTESESRDLAIRADQQLAELPGQDEPASSGNDPRQARTDVAQSRPTTEPLPRNSGAQALPSPPPVVVRKPEITQPPVNKSDQFYREALNIVQGRDVKSLQRAELLRALQLFQNVLDGAHTAEARNYADRLGKEYDRRRKKD